MEKGLTFIEDRQEELNKEHMLIMHCDNAQENISLKNKVKINKIKNINLNLPHQVHHNKMQRLKEL